MKKITLTIFSLLLFGGTLFSQTNSTGPIEILPLSSGTPYGAQIDVTATEVTLILGAPINRWLGIGFNATSMFSGMDGVIFDGTNLTDRNFTGGYSEPNMDTNQDWTVTNIDLTTQVGGVIVTATRALNTGEANDYVFNLTDTSINLIWAMGSSYTIAQHSLRGITSSGFTLGVDNFSLSKFKISPNPVTSEFNVELPSTIELADLEVYDVLGKMIYASQVSNFNSSIDSSSWHNGIYLVRVISGDVSQTKRIIKQ